MPSLPSNLTSEVASIKRDPYLPYLYGDRLEPRDETLINRGKGGSVRAYEIYSDIIKDCHASAILQKRWMEVIGREWDVSPATDSRADKKAADLCRDILQNLATRSQQVESSKETEITIGGGFDATCLDLLPAILNGFAVSEIIWEQDGQIIRPAEIIQRDVRRFSFGIGERGYKLRLLTQDNLFDGEPIPPRKMIIHRFNSGGMTSDPYGLGLGTRLFYPTFFKRNTVKFWLIFADKHGSPTAVIKHPQNANEAQKATYRKALRAIAQDAGILLPENVAVEFLEASRSSSINCYSDLVNFCNTEMSKAVLGETGSTDQSSGGGSRARDEVGNSVRIAIAKFDADLLSDTLNRTLLTWITRLNFGDDVAPPKVWRKFPELEEKEDLNGRIGRDKQLFDLGFKITKEKVDQVYGDGYEATEIEQKPEEMPLVDRLGSANFGLFMQLLSQIAQGSLTRESAIATLTIGFGLSQDEAEAIVPEAQEGQSNNPDAAPDIGGLIGGGEVEGEPEADAVEEPAPEEPETAEEEAPEVELSDRPSPDDAVNLSDRLPQPSPVAQLTETLRKKAQPEFAKMTGQLRELLSGSGSLVEFRDKLDEIYPELDGESLAAIMAEAMFASKLAGIYEAQGEGEVELGEEEESIAPLIPPSSIESTLDASEVVEESADFKAPLFGKGSRKATGKTPNCTPFKSWSCGFACLPMSKRNCPSAVEGKAKTLADYLSTQIKNNIVKSPLSDRKQMISRLKGQQTELNRLGQLASEAIAQVQAKESMQRFIDTLKNELSQSQSVMNQLIADKREELDRTFKGKVDRFDARVANGYRRVYEALHPRKMIRMPKGTTQAEFFDAVKRINDGDKDAIKKYTVTKPAKKKRRTS